MKKSYPLKVLSILAVGLMLSTIGLAQQKKFYLGGQLGGNYTKSKGITIEGPGSTTPVEQKAHNFWLYPEFGYMLRENTALGIRLNFMTTTIKTTMDDTKSTSYGFSPYVRYFIPLWKTRFSIYNDLGLSIDFDNAPELSSEYYKGNIKETSIGAYYTPGLQFRLKSNINLLANVSNLIFAGYLRKKGELIDNPPQGIELYDTSDTFSVAVFNDFGINRITLGVNFLF